MPETYIYTHYKTDGVTLLQGIRIRHYRETQRRVLPRYENLEVLEREGVFELILKK